MSRSGYTDDFDADSNWGHIMWRGRVASAAKGKRGQKFFRDLLEALDALPQKRLIANSLEVPERVDPATGEPIQEYAVCALGALGRARGVDMRHLDPEDTMTVGGVFDIAEPLVREVVYMNDEWCRSSEQRWADMRAWVKANIKDPAP